MKVDYKIEEIFPNIFSVVIENQYDLTMTFCRAQEFYESPLKEIRGKKFSMVRFQKLYSETFGEGAFTYPTDWEGFNLPSNVIKKFYNVMWTDVAYSDEYNDYDDVFEEMIIEIEEISKNKRYYVIGTNGKDQETINHEVAHAFYYLYPSYRKNANKIVDKIPKRIFNKIEGWILDVGYSKNVIKDEIQAYLSANNANAFYGIRLTNTEKKVLENINKDLKKLVEKYKKAN